MTHITNYKFTSLSGADLLGDGDNWLERSDVFTMPLSTMASLSVSDNDSEISVSILEETK